MGEKPIRMARQASLTIKSSFNSVLYGELCNTNRPFNKLVEYVFASHELRNVVYVLSCLY